MAKKNKGQDEAQQDQVQAQESASALTVAYPSKGKSFTVPRRYEEGHTLSTEEANALNGLLTENIRNNFSKTLEKMISDGKTDEEINAAFAAYAEGYAFAGRRSTRAPVDPVQREAEKIATAKLDEALRKMGKSRKNLADGVFDKHVTELASKQEIQDEAKRRVETTKAIATDSLTDLLAGEVQDAAPAAATA